ncbi:DUF3187 family protein [Parahaliea aestuarii]|uniref:DUF3187 family protein n=1 Tax=Parahaliea aestuarii TaxID=1852021 RepID=A0A5C8ZS17_9GAMM|nr:DUF3187 family protein [Parahaliea aestuarii]TXS90529.1 DUF3187 family protein [Parahaliea aestuarii]
MARPFPAAAAGTLLAACCAATSLPLSAAGEEPLYVKNLSPVAGLVGLPSQRSAAVGEAGAWQLALHGSVASHYVSDRGAREALNLDGETQRLALELRYAFAPDWELQLELPWLRQDAGFLDSAIDGWHDFWGMPDGGRGEAPGDVLDYRYADPGLRFALEDDGSGIGDASLALQHAFYRGETATLSVAAGYKFGSGDARDFTGSGEGDVYVALRASGADLAGLPLDWHAQAGYLRAGEVAMLGPRQERDLWFAGGALSWRFAGDWRLLGQFDAHAAPIDSAIDALGSTAMMLSAGLRWHPAPDWSLDFAVIEDIAVETAPDVVFQFDLRYRP